jgi:hypothetical protein
MDDARDGEMESAPMRRAWWFYDFIIYLAMRWVNFYYRPFSTVQWFSTTMLRCPFLPFAPSFFSYFRFYYLVWRLSPTTYNM